MLSQAEIETYHRDGYVIAEGFKFNDTELAELRNALDAVLAQNPDIMADRLIELKAGQVSMHDIGIIHGSAANTSGRRRAGLALRYMPSTSCMYRVMPNAAARWGDMPMELVRGANRNERNDPSLGDFGQT